MRNFLIAVVMLIASCLAACGANTMPQIGNALLKARDFYVAGDRVQAQVEHVAELVCKEPAPEAVNMCADVAESLATANQYNDAARNALILAMSAYNTVNEELLKDADAGAP